MDMVQINSAPQSLKAAILERGILIKGNKSLQQQLQNAQQ
jgi:hypothetical protein